MGIELIRRAICDRCGEICSCVSTNTYHYAEMSLKTFDSRDTDYAPKIFVLCGHCSNDLSEWIKQKENTIREENIEKIYYMLQENDCNHWFRDNADMLRLAEYLAKKGFIAFQNDEVRE